MTTQTLYAELMEQLVALEAHRSVGTLPGCFTTKTVKGERYVYFQHTEPGGTTRQIYLGRESAALGNVIQLFHDQRKASGADAVSIQTLCAQLRAGGALVTDTASARVLKTLSDCGVFRLDGVLIGTQAFSVLGNLLGVRWTGASLKTQDIDLAGERTLDIALPNIQADVPKALESLQMGFLPVPPLNPKQSSTSFKVRGSSLRVDVVTPAGYPVRRAPVIIPRFRTAAQPLRFLDFLIKKPVQGAIIDAGGVLVQVPDPARFALHKMIVAQEREVTGHSKTEKDLLQAAQLVGVLAVEREGDLLLAWDDVCTHGESWIKRIRSSFGRMAGLFPDEAYVLKKILRL